MQQNIPKPVSIILCYDQVLEKITHKKQESVIVSEGLPFIMLLQTIFSCYPEIQAKYPPGILAMLVSGKPPIDFSIMKEGDIVELSIPKNKINNALN